MVLRIEDLMYSLFVNRSDYYAEQFLNKGKKGFKKIKGVITPQLIKEHLEQKKFIGVYQLNKDSQVKWGCLDFDNNTLEDFEQAKKVYEYSLQKGYHPCFEFSGGGDYKVHIWFFSKDLIQAKQMRLFLEKICKESGVIPHEVFPKQDEIVDLGNLVKLPLGLHLVTKNKSVFIKKGYEKLFDEEEIRQKLEVHLTNKDIIPFDLSQTKEQDINISLKKHDWDSFFSQTLKQSIPEGTSKEVKIGSKEAGINNNIIKNQARWFFEKGYTEELLKKEIKPIYDSNGWAFGDLIGWFKKCERGHILEINKKEILEWVKNYYPSLELFIPQREKETPKVIENLQVKTYMDYKKLKKNKNFIVDSFLYNSSINMIYSPPAQFKSLIAQNLGISIANGRDWLGFKTKKCSVLYLDGENSNEIIKIRLINQHKGMKLTRNNFPFYILKGGTLINENKKVNIGFLVALERIIEEYKIKVIIFDTLHRFAFYDENRSDDINLLYTKVFQPLVQDYGLSIIFLHHSTKTGGYRGSGDFLGSVDVAYRISRIGKSNRFTIINEKCRNGEIENINGEIDFGDDYIKIRKIQNGDNDSSDDKIKKLKDTTNKIHEIVELGVEVKRKEIIDMLEMQKFDYGNLKSVQRALKFLCDTGKFDKTERGIYRKLK